MAAVGKVLTLSQFLLRLLQVCASTIILGIFSYFLAVLGDHDMDIAPWIAAVEGISGAATFYSIAASICVPLSKKGFFSGLAMILDFLFGAGCIAIAVMAREGANSCTGHVNTPLGDGDANDQAAGFGDQGFGVGDGQQVTYMANLQLACRLQKAVFAVSIIGIFLFFVSVVTQRLYTAHYKHGRQHGSTLKNPFVDSPKRQWRFWPSESHKPGTTGRSASAVDYSGDRSSTGSIPLSEQPTASRPPRYTRIFGWGQRNNDRDTVPEQQTGSKPQANAWNSDSANNSDPYLNSPTGGSGYRGAQPTYAAHHDSPYSGGWAGDNGYARYSYGRSGVDDAPFAHGYGNSPYQTNF